MKQIKERNYWPHAIVGMILIVVIAGAYTIKIAVDNPVQEDTYFMEKYQKVNKDINKLMKKKSDFDKNFTISYSTLKFNQGTNSISIEVKDKTDANLVKNADITLLVTRPETNEFNQNLKPTKIENGKYIFDNIKINKPGRWKILTDIKINKFEGYNTYEVYATK